MLSRETIEIIESTIPLLEADGEEIIRHFYDNLLVDNPELNHFFNASNQSNGMQAKALANAVFAYANNLNDVSVLLPAVSRIAHKHVSLGVKPEQYPIIGGALVASIQTVANLPAGHQILKAWAEAYDVLAQIFIDTEEGIYERNKRLPNGWRGFREFEVDMIESESYNVKSFYLKPTAGTDLPAFKGGQYIGVKVRSGEAEYDQMRQYSLSSKRMTDCFRITVKREEAGRVSTYLHSLTRGAKLLVQSPTGVFNLDRDVKKHVFIAGGVGITPLMSMLHEAIELGLALDDVLFVQSQQNSGSKLFKRELMSLKVQKALHYRAWVTGQEGRRIEQADLAQWVEDAGIKLNDETAVYICGPTLFMRDMKGHFESLGMPMGSVHCEFFGPTE